MVLLKKVERFILAGLKAGEKSASMRIDRGIVTFHPDPSCEASKLTRYWLREDQQHREATVQGPSEGSLPNHILPLGPFLEPCADML